MEYEIGNSTRNNEKMAKVVDNHKRQLYNNMHPEFDKSIAFKTACELVFQGKDQPSVTQNLYFT